MNRCKLVDIYPLKSCYYRPTVTITSHQMKFQCLKILRNDMKRPILNTSTSHGEWISLSCVSGSKPISQKGLTLKSTDRKCNEGLTPSEGDPSADASAPPHWTNYCTLPSDTSLDWNVADVHKKTRFTIRILPESHLCTKRSNFCRMTVQHTPNLNISGHLGVRYPHTKHDAQWGYCVH